MLGALLRRLETFFLIHSCKPATLCNLGVRATNTFKAARGKLKEANATTAKLKTCLLEANTKAAIAQTNCDAATTQLADSTDRTAKLTSELHAANTLAAVTQANWDATTRQLDEEKATVARLTGDLRTSQETATDAQAEARTSTVRLSEAEAELTGLRSALSTANAALHEEHAALQTASNKGMSTQISLDSTTALHKEVQATAKGLAADLELARSRLAEATTCVEVATVKLENVQAISAKQTERIEQLTATVESTKASEAAAKDQVAQLTENAATLEAEVSNAVVRNELISSRLAEANAINAVEVQRNATLETDIELMQSSFDKLCVQLTAAEREQGTTAAKIDASSRETQSQVAELTSELESMAAKCDAVTSNLSATTAQFLRANAQLETCKVAEEEANVLAKKVSTELEDCNANIKELEASNAHLLVQYNTADEELACARIATAGHIANEAGLAAELKSVTSKLSEQATIVVQLEQDVAVSTAQVASIEGYASKLSNDLSSLQKQRDSMVFESAESDVAWQTKVQQLDEKVRVNNDEYAELAAEHKKILESVSTKTANADADHAAELEAAQNAQTTLQTENERLCVELDQSLAQKMVLTATADELRAQCTHAEQRLAQACQDASAEANGAKTEIGALNSKSQALEEELSKMKKELILERCAAQKEHDDVVSKLKTETTSNQNVHSLHQVLSTYLRFQGPPCFCTGFALREVGAC